MNQIEKFLPLIPLLPLIGFVLNGLFGRYFDRRVVAGIACGTLGASFVISAATFIALAFPTGDAAALSKVGHAVAYNWFSLGLPGGELSLDFGFYVDNLTAIMLLVVTGVGTLIHIYSVGYMADDPGFSRFFAYLNLFCFSMLVLVMADNLVLLFVGWEGVGLCSYLLIGFWYTDMDKAKAGQKAFVTNRIGDLAVLLAMFMFVGILGTLSIPQINDAARRAMPAPAHADEHHAATPANLATHDADGDAAPAGHEETAGHAAAGGGSPLLVEWAWLIALLLFIGACGKSAQIPLYVWLPDAMAGPTPVSALIHAATMVTAGVFLIVRLGAFFALSPLAGGIITLVGASTALLAALIALSQRDIKKVLAYSTVSQLGYMFMAAGAGAIYPAAYVAAIFHLVTHAFFKALLFMGAGSVIHGMHHAYPTKGEEFTQDMFNMGGLAKKMKITYLTFVAGSVALAGIVPFSGFWSKDEILHGVFEAGVNGADAVPVLYWIGFAFGLIAAALTAFYTTRMVVLTFHGEHRSTAEGYKHLHESPALMWVPLLILGVLSLAGGIINLPGTQFLGHGLTGFLMDSAQNDSSQLAVTFAPHLHHHTASDDAFGWIFGSLSLESLLLMLGSTLIAVGGAWFGYKTYTANKEKHAAKFAPGTGWEKARQLSYGKFFVDEIYKKYILDPIYNLASILYVLVDRLLIDIAISIGAQIVYHISRASRAMQTGLLSFYALSFVVGVMVVLIVVMVQMLYL